MERISVNAYAKINLSINVTGKREDGYHQVEMIMQQVDLSDIVEIQWNPAENQTFADRSHKASADEPSQSCADKVPRSCTDETPRSSAVKRAQSPELSFQLCAERISRNIVLTCNLPYLPIQEDNIAFRAARLMVEECGMAGLGTAEIHLIKRIPVAAGLAGGSADGAAVLHGLNRLWEKGLSLKKLMELGKRLGADVPFCVMGQAALNSNLGFTGQDEMASSCALACGIGADLTPLPSMKGWTVLTKPPFSVSTAEVYESLCLNQITDRPDTQRLVRAIRSQNWYLAAAQMKNVLEQVTLERYPQVKKLMSVMQTQCSPYQTRMSGSGPTVLGLFLNREKAQKAFQKMKQLHRDTYLARLL